MRYLILILFFTLPVFGKPLRLYKVQEKDTKESIALSLNGNAASIKKILPASESLPAPGKYLRIDDDEFLRLKCNMQKQVKTISVNGEPQEAEIYFARKTFTRKKDLYAFIKRNSDCISNLRPWRSLTFVSYSTAYDSIEEKNQSVSTNTKVYSFTGMEISHRSEIGFVSPWVLQARFRLMKGTTVKGFALGAQTDLELGIGKEISKNKQFVHLKYWQNQFEFVGNDETNYLDSYNNSGNFLGLSYEYLTMVHQRPWIADVSAYYQLNNSFEPTVNGSKEKLSGYAVKANLKIPIAIGSVDNLFLQPGWQYVKYNAAKYDLTINQFSLLLGLRF